MSCLELHSPIILNQNEQVVLAVDSRILPSISDAMILLLFITSAFVLLPMLVIHRSFRPMCYVITTERIIVIEPGGKLDEIGLLEITKIKSTKTSLMVYGVQKRLWLSRLPDAWFFESVVWNVVTKTGLVDGEPIVRT